jgi:hypothetical protein
MSAARARTAPTLTIVNDFEDARGDTIDQSGFSGTLGFTGGAGFSAAN